MPVPSSLALTSIVDGSSIVAADHRNNYAAVQSAVNALIGFFGSGSTGSTLRYNGTDWARTTNILLDDATSKITLGGDATLYRVVAGTLKTDGSFQVVGNLNVDVAGAANQILFGSASDVNLYRGAADRLNTDDHFGATTLGLATKQKAGAPVDGDWAVAPPNGTLVVDSTNNKLWARVAGVWKGVIIA